MCLWYGGLADIIPVALLNYWNLIQMGVTIVELILCAANKRISSVALMLIFYKVSLLFSTLLNGRPVDTVEFSRYLGLILFIELFRDDLKTIISVMMLIFEIMIYYNLFTCIQNGPDLFGAYYGALGYDNGFPPYLLAGYFILCLYYEQSKSWLRPAALWIAIHATLFITFSATGIMGIVVVDFLILLYYIKSWKITLFKSYLILLSVEIAIVLLRIQNVFSYIIVNLLGKDLTFTGRTKDWDRAMEMIPQKLFFGHGMMDQATEKSILGDTFCHNGILEQLFRGGIIYFLIFALIIVLVSMNVKNVESNAIQKGIFVVCGFWTLSITEVVLEGIMLSMVLELIFAIGKARILPSQYIK